MTETMDAIELAEIIGHASRRSRCHYACGPRCECECGGKYHRAGHSIALPPEVGAALARARTRNRGGNVRSRRRRRARSQMSLPL